jgi:class 3 adenylate cyclase
MPKLRASERARLPDSAFAYVDPQGRRRLPIHDEAHVRNALGRFERVAFEDDAARERARKRLLVAAKRYGIVPVGFITGQLQKARTRPPADPLPTGLVTFLLTDIEGSTALLTLLGDGYGRLLRDVRGVIRSAVRRAGGREVDARADEFFAVFELAPGAIEAAAAIQRRLAERPWPQGVSVRVRAGIHSGRTKLTDAGYIGLSVHTTARICAVAHGGQIVVSSETRAALARSMPAGMALRRLGTRRLAGLARPETLFQVQADGLLAEFPPLRRSRASEPAPRP